MIDAKRLAELMTPEKMREVADWCGDPNRCGAGSHRGQDMLEAAAAVLREVAKSKDKPTCSIIGCEDSATLEDGTPLTARIAFGEVPMCVKHYELLRKTRELEAKPLPGPDRI